MPRYFFHVIDGASFRDETGTELPDIDAARAQAIRLSGEILQETGARFWNGTAWKLIVTDNDERTLFELRFSAEEHTNRVDPRPDPSSG